MKLGSILARSEAQAPDDMELRELRIEAARRNPSWSELREVDLVTRGPFLVHADTDQVYTRYRGIVFTDGAAKPSFNEQVEMTYYVDQATSAVVFLERCTSPATWSEVVERKARRGAARRA